MGGGNKDYVEPKQFITNGSLAADFTSNPIEVLGLKRIGIILSWTTSDVSGIIYPQAMVAMDIYENLPKNDAGDPITVAVSGAAGHQTFDIDVHAFNKIQIFFDYTAGTAGTINGWWLAKGKLTG